MSGHQGIDSWVYNMNILALEQKRNSTTKNSVESTFPVDFGSYHVPSGVVFNDETQGYTRGLSKNLKHVSIFNCHFSFHHSDDVRHDGMAQSITHQKVVAQNQSKIKVFPLCPTSLKRKCAQKFW